MPQPSRFGIRPATRHVLVNVRIKGNEVDEKLKETYLGK